MTNADTLALYAEVWQDVQERDWPLKYGGAAWHLHNDTENVWSLYTTRCAPSWSLTLALGTLRLWLEGKGWEQSVRRDYEDNITAYWWTNMGLWRSGETGDFDCPHRAAIAAARIDKEQA